MELLDRYIEAVARQLPRRMRKDIPSEIRSTLLDMLEERRSAQPGIPDETLLADLLRSYGSPARVAASYLPERALIGAQLFPFFSLVVKITLAVLGALALFGLGASLSAGPLDLRSLIDHLGSSLVGLYSGAIAAFGNIVLVFAILERVLPQKEIKSLYPHDETWNPAELIKAPPKDEVRLWEPVLAVLFSFIALVIFNFYPQLLSYTPSLEKGSGSLTVSIPIFTDAFFRLLPWLNLQWLLTILLNLRLVRRRRWTAGTRFVSIGIKLLGIAILVAMLRGPALFNLTPAALAAWPSGLEAFKSFSHFFESLIRIILMLAIFGSVVEIIKELYRILTEPVSRKG